MKLLCPLSCLVVGLGLIPFASAQTTLFSQNFDGLGAQVITNPSGTTTTEVAPNTSGSLGTGTGAFNYYLGSQQSLAIVNNGGGNLAATLTDNNTVANNSIIQTNFTGVSTTGTGNNIINGSFDYTALTLNSGTTGNFVFGLGTTNTNSTGSTTTAIQLIFNNGTSIAYQNGATGMTVSNTLTIGTTYTIAISADFSSDTQDTWALTITNTGTGASVSSLTGISTRAANITPGSVFFSAATFNSRSSPDPMFQIDNINFTSTSAIPEPGTYALLIGAASLMAVTLRRRRR